jgi:hypothetical protein
MPRISSFYGIAIYMYYRDHGVPHFMRSMVNMRPLLTLGAARSRRDRCRSAPRRLWKSGAGSIGMS